MNYVDRIYGAQEITNQVVIDIIQSAAFQRLKGIDQAGYSHVYFPGTEHSRFEHSVGCYLLLKKFDAPIEEQIAGLIHDMSHSAFSHTADYVFATGCGANQNYQDDIFDKFVRTTEIPDILKKHGYDVDYILNKHNFPLQENTLPDICADRIDYSLRGAVIYDDVSQSVIDEILQHLHVDGSTWVFDSYNIAQKYATLFKRINDVYYSGVQTAAMFSRVSQWLLHGVAQGYITHDDIYTTDQKVITKINAHLTHDHVLQKLWDIMNDTHIVCGNADTAHTYSVDVKSRIIDPFFREDGKCLRVSARNVDWGQIVQKDLVPKTHYLVDAQ